MSTRSSARQRAKEYGVDTTLLEASLEKTPTERARDLEETLEFAEKLREAGRKYYADKRRLEGKK